MSATKLIGVKSFGAYLPARRMSRAVIADAHAWAFPSLKSLGKGEKTLCGWDEDVITMAVEAGRDCLRDMRADQIDMLDLASTTAPYADLQNAVIVASALRLNRDTTAADHGGSTRAGIAALSRCCVTDTHGDRLIVAAEKRNAKPASAQELSYGSGAGALLIGEGPDLIAQFLGSESVSVPFVDHFRHEGQKFDYFWEERWIRDEGISKIVPGAIAALLKRLDISVDRVKHFGLAGPTGADKLVAKALGIAPESLLPDLQGQVGDTGSAHSMLLLIEAFERAAAGDVIVVGSFAQGCELIAFKMLAAASGARRGLARTLARRIPETSYLKMLSFDGNIELEWGMRAEVDQKTPLTQFYRVSEQMLGFVGGKCSSCAAVQFPRLPRCVNCGEADSQAPFVLADEPGRVATFTADWLQYTPSPPLYIGLVQFDVGARLPMEIVDVGTAGIEVGTRLEMRLRIKERDRLRGYDRYFWKAVPIAQ